MFTLIIGGAASGKSAYAEALALGNAPRIYIATMQPFDSECHARIEKHRTMRRDKGFDTVECYTRLKHVTIPQGSTVLLECMSNLCANEMYSEEGSGAGAEEAILDGVEKLLAHCGELIIVSNEVFSGGSRYEGETLRYLEVLAGVNRKLAAQADNVCEIVCGIPTYHKGRQPR